MRVSGIVATAAIGAAIVVSLGRVAWPVNPLRVAADLALAFGPIEGPVVDAPGSASLTLLPRPTLHIDKLNVHAVGQAYSARATSGEVELRFDRLLFGEFTATRLSLHEADVRIDLDAAGASIGLLKKPPFPHLALQGGVVTLTSARRDWVSRFEVASASIDWARPTSMLSLAATGRWRDQPAGISFDLASPLAAARGEASAIRVAVDAPLAQLQFTGDWSPGGQLEGGHSYRGQISALVPSIPRFSYWLGIERGSLSAGLEIEAQASGDGETMRLSEARLVWGGQSFEGALDLAKTRSGVAASGTLAADALDLEPLIGPPPALFDEAGDWSKAPLLPSLSERMELDLRVSATRALWGGLALDNPAGAISQRGGFLSVKLLEAGFAQGSLSGEISVGAKQNVCESRIALALDNADLGALLGDFGMPNFKGHGALKASFRARGRAPSEMVATADGEGSLEMADGALLSINFEEALRRGRRHPIDVARDMNAGPTRFTAARSRVEISDGEARFVDTATRAPGVSLMLTGLIDLPGRTWRARVEARESAADGEPTPDGAHIDFSLDGPWNSPILAPLSPPAD